MFRLLVQKVLKNKKNSFIHAFFKFAPMFIWPILHLSEKYDELIIIANLNTLSSFYKNLILDTFF